MSLEGLDAVALRTLADVVRHGGFEAAARAQHVTPSAVSQRIRALEARVGRPLVRRTRPTSATDAGRVLIRLATQVELLSREAQAELTGVDGDVEGLADLPHPEITLVVNADSLATWVLPVLAQVQARHRVRFEVIREDEGHSLDVLRHGQALGAVTSDPTPVQGCRVVPLALMRYLPVASPDYLARWLPDGATADALAGAPMLAFDRKDSMQHDLLLAVTGRWLTPPTTYVPSARGHAEAARLGMGWGLLPEAWIRDDLRAGRLVRITPGRTHDIALYWQHWALRSVILDDLTAALRAGASARMPPAA